MLLLAIVTGKEMGEIPAFTKIREVKDFVLNWLGKQTGFYRSDYTNSDTGWNNIGITPKGVDDTLQHTAQKEKIH